MSRIRNTFVLILAGLALATTAFAEAPAHERHRAKPAAPKAAAPKAPTHKTFEVGWSVLAAMPAGDLGKTSGAAAGYAKGGFGMQFDVLAHPDPLLELGAAVAIAQAPLDDKTYSTNLTAGLPVDANPWLMQWYMAEAGVSRPLTKRVRGFADLYSGVLAARKPAVQVMSASNTLQVADTSPSFKGHGFAWGVGGGLRFHEHLFVAARYLASKPTLSAPGLPDAEQRVDVVHLAVGGTFGH